MTTSLRIGGSLFVLMLPVFCLAQPNQPAPPDSPTRVALDFVTTVFIDRDAARIPSFCHDDARQQGKLPTSEKAGPYLQKLVAKLPPPDTLALKHLHVFRKNDVSNEFLKEILPTVKELDMQDSFQPYVDAMKDGFCCIAIFDVSRGGRAQSYMFTFAFSPASSGYKLALMGEGSAR